MHSRHDTKGVSQTRKSKRWCQNNMHKYQESNQPEILQIMPKKKGINVFVLLFLVLIVAAILTYIIPAGEYTRVMENGRSLVKPGTFKLESSSPVDLFGFLTA